MTGKVEQPRPGQRRGHTSTALGSRKCLGAGGIGRIPCKNVATAVRANSSLAVPTSGTFTAFFGNSKSVGGNGLGRNWMVPGFDFFSKLLI